MMKHYEVVSYDDGTTRVLRLTPTGYQNNGRVTLSDTDHAGAITDLYQHMTGKRRYLVHPWGWHVFNVLTGVASYYAAVWLL